jgi:sialic acid synthase SpsE
MARDEGILRVVGASAATSYDESVTSIRIGDRYVGPDQPTYFIADIAANHDGDLGRAIELMTLAKDAGADCAKFQHFRAAHIVSDYGFRSLGGQQSHQASWSKSVVEVYEDASLPWEWTRELADHARAIGIEFMSAPYDPEAVAHLDPYVNAVKVGSGDINWLEELEVIAATRKPVIIAAGASTLEDVARAMNLLEAAGVDIVLMQCNTNYTGSIENLHYVNLRVLQSFADLYPRAVLGLSDHTPGHVTVLGAVTLGARVIEKHFTDDTTRVGPDHGFSLDPVMWRAMVDDTRKLEAALGSGVKSVEENERQTAVLQRRCVRAARDLPAGGTLTRDDLEVLRPAPADAIPAHEVGLVVGRALLHALVSGQDVRWTDLA